MTIYLKMAASALVAITMVTQIPVAQGELVTSWVTHNGTSTVSDAETNAPTFTAADNITVMAPFSTISLANDGDSISFSATLTINNRSGGVGINSLNTQLRLGLFNGNAGAVVAGDSNNLGFIIEYSNLVAGGLIREQQSAIQTFPFTSPTDLGNGVQDSGADSIQGANPGPVLFELTLTRSGGLLDLFGKISGTDSVSTNPYLSTYTKNGISSTNFPADSTFSFNRVAMFLGDNVNGASANMSGAVVTFAVPESRFGLLAVALVIGCVLTGLKARRTWLSRNQQPG